MKAKKAIKRLRKAHLLLSSVVKQYTESRFPMRDLSDAADSIDRAKAFLEANGTSSSTSKTANRSQKGRGSTKRRTIRGLTEGARRKLSLAAKKRWAAAKRKGMTTLGS
jgi:hypothetical protein